MKKYYLTLTILILLAGFSCKRNNKLEAELEDIMFEFIEESVAPGMGLGYFSEKTGTILLAVGKADVENNIPIEIGSNYPIQSTTKMFMSILTLQLIEEDKLELESTIDEWIDYVPNNSKITIRHLLTHTSGLNYYLNNSEFIDEYFSGRENKYTRNDLIRAGLEVSHDKEIGNWEYSNTNYLILANIIETITQQSIFKALEQRIFRPAEMNHTYFKPGITGDTTSIIKCYRFGESIDLEKWNYLANTGGGIVSTIKDMLKFAHWIMDNNYHLLMAAESELTNRSDSGAYGLGIEIGNEMYCIPMMGHSGGNPGLIHFFSFSKETGEIIVYYLNEGRAGKPFGKFMKDLDEILQRYR